MFRLIVWLGMLTAPSMVMAALVDRPNFLILMADNWHAPHAGANGDPVVKTPTFDALAQRGVRFTHAFCVVPSCAPARAAFLTGQTIHRLDEAANLHGDFPSRFRTFPDALEKAGYAVGFSGKGWGPGRFQTTGRTRNPAGNPYESFEQFLGDAPRERPFCFWFSSKNPHIPWETGIEQKATMQADRVRVPAYLPDVPEVRDNILDYYAEVQSFDTECAALMATLERDGRAANTWVIMTGDNGWQMPHGLAHIYDAGTRVPLVIVGPRGVAPPRVSEALVNFDDFAPTLLELAGLDAWPECTGRSLVAMLRSGVDPADRDAVFLERERHANVRRGDRSYPVRAVRTKDYLYVRNLQPSLWPAGDPEVYFAVGDYGDVDGTRSKHYILDRRQDPAMGPFLRMNFDRRPAEELYDLRADPDQTRNVVEQAEYAAVRNQLADRLSRWMRETADPRATNPNDERWDRAPYYGNPAKKRS